MIIKDWSVKIKAIWQKIGDYRQEAFVTAIIVLTAGFSFGLGRLSKIVESRPPVKIISAVSQVNNSASVSDVLSPTSVSPTATGEIAGKVVSSKNGKKYYYPWCAGVSRIKEENKVWFQSEKEAESAGFTIASGCK
jgi:hypothetical protein